MTLSVVSVFLPYTFSWIKRCGRDSDLGYNSKSTASPWLLALL